MSTSSLQINANKPYFFALHVISSAYKLLTILKEAKKTKQMETAEAQISHENNYSTIVMVKQSFKAH